MFFQRHIIEKFATAVLIVVLMVLIAEVVVSVKMCSHYELKASSTAETLEKELIALPNVETLEKELTAPPNVETLEKELIALPNVETLEKELTAPPNVETLEKELTAPPNVETLEKEIIALPNVETLEKELIALPNVETLEKEHIALPNVETVNGSKVPPGALAQEPSEEDIAMFKFPVVASLAADAINITISSEKLVAELVSSDKKLGCEEAVNWPESSSDIYFSMKSIAAYHAPRLSLLLVTWLQTVDPLQVHIVTDSDADPWIQALQNRGTRVTVTTTCQSGHKFVASQCCKAGLQYKGYYMAAKMEQKKYRWFCHFDDDVYVNIAQLVRMLKSYDPTTEKLYLGHYPVHLWRPWRRNNEDRLSYGNLTTFPERKRNSYVYATGASYCISSSLMESLEKYLSGHNFHATCNKLQAADDLVIGIIIDAVLGYNLVEVPNMMSEVNDLTKLNRSLTDLITIGYHLKAEEVPRKYNYYLDKNNRVIVPGSPFTELEDPSSFLSYHCLLYPTTSWCVVKRDQLHREERN